MNRLGGRPSRAGKLLILSFVAVVLSPALVSCTSFHVPWVSSKPSPTASATGAPGSVNCTSKTSSKSASGKQRKTHKSSTPATVQDVLNIPKVTPDGNGTKLDGYWGPRRALYTECSASSTPVLDSISDDQNKLWENDFFSLDSVPVAAKDASDQTAKWTWDRLNVKSGATYWANVYIWNDVGSGISDGATSGARLRIDLPQGLKGDAFVEAQLSALNTTPGLVYAGDVLHNPDPSSSLQASIVPGSAYVEMPGVTYSLDAKDLTSDQGALIGCSSGDGVLTGDSDCKGRAYFQIRVSKPVITSSVVAPASEASTLDTTAGSTINVLASSDNTTSDPLSGFSFAEQLPPGTTYVAGSAQTYVLNADGSESKHYPVEFSGDPPTSDFSVYSIGDVPAKARYVVQYRMAIGNNLCHGSWEPVRSRVTQGTAAVESVLLVNVVPTC